MWFNLGMETAAPANAVYVDGFSNAEDGVKSEVHETPRGYVVTLIDTDTNGTLPTARIFRTEGDALDYAQSIVEGTAPRATDLNELAYRTR